MRSTKDSRAAISNRSVAQSSRHQLEPDSDRDDLFRSYIAREAEEILDPAGDKGSAEDAATQSISPSVGPGSKGKTSRILNNSDSALLANHSKVTMPLSKNGIQASHNTPQLGIPVRSCTY